MRANSWAAKTAAVALLVSLLGACGGSADDKAPSSKDSSQTVSDATICDLLFAPNGPMREATKLMSHRQTLYSYASQARLIVSHLSDISERAGSEMSAKISAVSDALMDYARWVENPAGDFDGQDFSVAGLEVGHACGM